MPVVRRGCSCRTVNCDINLIGFFIDTFSSHNVCSESVDVDAVDSLWTAIGIELVCFNSSSQVCQSFEVNAADSMWTVIEIESFSFINTYEITSTKQIFVIWHFSRRQECTAVNSKHPPSLWTVTRMSWPRLELGEVGYFIDTPDEPTSLACTSANGRVTRSPWTVATFAVRSLYTTVTHGSSRSQLWVRTSDELL